MGFEWVNLFFCVIFVNGPSRVTRRLKCGFNTLDGLLPPRIRAAVAAEVRWSGGALKAQPGCCTAGNTAIRNAVSSKDEVFVAEGAHRKARLITRIRCVTSRPTSRCCLLICVVDEAKDLIILVCIIRNTHTQKKVSELPSHQN